MTKALTLTQPWASLVMAGVKRIETRGWRTAYRGPLVIHAGKAWTRWDRELAIEMIERGLIPYARGIDDLPEAFPLGVALGTVELIAVAPTGYQGRPLNAISNNQGRPPYYLTDLERELGDYSPGRFAWLLADPEPFPEPVPCRGRLGLWEFEVAAVQAGNFEVAAAQAGRGAA